MSSHSELSLPPWLADNAMVTLAARTTKAGRPQGGERRLRRGEAGDRGDPSQRHLDTVASTFGDVRRVPGLSCALSQSSYAARHATVCAAGGVSPLRECWAWPRWPKLRKWCTGTPRSPANNTGGTVEDTHPQCARRKAGAARSVACDRLSGGLLAETGHCLFFAKHFRKNCSSTLTSWRRSCTRVALNDERSCRRWRWHWRRHMRFR